MSMLKMILLKMALEQLPILFVEKGLDIPYYSSRWEELSTNIAHTYDALMCAGNSFITIATYENPEYSIQQDSAKLRMQLAVA